MVLGSKIEILNSETHLEWLFLAAMRIGLDRLHVDPDYPATAQEIITQFEEPGDMGFGLESVKLLIQQEGLSSGEPALTMQAEALVMAFRNAGFAEINQPGSRLMERGMRVILANF